jgi:transcriptional regulator with XRE-family HTH domain
MSTRETARTPRQVFGAMLRYYRERAGLSRTELARQISKSVSLIQAIELGQRAATADVTEDLERVLPADGALTRLRDEIGDGLGYGAYPSWFQDWLAGERECKKLRLFGPLLVPGLLQTEGYARAVFGTRFGVTDEEISEQVAGRLKRQEILIRDEPPALWVIVDESVLRRPVGGRYVMREQIGRLIEAVRRPHVSVQVISCSVGAYRGLWAGGFAIADFEDATAVGYQETACQGQFVDRREDVQTLTDCWDTLVREALP